MRKILVNGDPELIRVKFTRTKAEDFDYFTEVLSGHAAQSPPCVCTLNMRLFNFVLTRQ